VNKPTANPDTPEKNLRPNRTVYTVSRVNQDVNHLLESQIGLLWIEGELSNLSRPGSGHLYFSLKDSRAQLRCAMFKGRNRYLDFQPDNGQQVLVRGKLGVYEARGDFQLIIEHMEPAGAGKLQQQFEATRKRLQQEGLFDTERKRALPDWPETIGVVTSPTGAAVRDIVQVLKRRYPRAHVIIYPTVVQGAAAVQPLCQALELAAQRDECEVLIVARGGGSLEDLWAFNEELVARSIAGSPIPVVAGIGHEIDFTIADMAADHRAPTPSAAAELVSPDSTRASAELTRLHQQLARSILHKIAPAQALTRQLNSRLLSRHPRRVVQQQTQRTDELENRLRKAVIALHDQQRLRLGDVAPRLHLFSPRRRVEQHKASVASQAVRLETLMRQALTDANARLSGLARALDAVSPLATLSRGYSVIRKQSQIVTQVSELEVGDVITAQLADGSVSAQITESSDPVASD